ncbi:hypothetical protein KUTeg_014930 [Tegillarca granosa]|uniref:C-type lectin domain-containing protein n=1 Tax=Tegillarca granosa TaxID=220873 RepID=A0ABQ9ENL5_TEGGR|nr:hypothetical protein KUTeg_014930 [Tegillarca granosa]
MFGISYESNANCQWATMVNGNIAINPQSTLPVRPHSIKCGELWEEDPNTDYCYQFNTKTLDWEDSRDNCRTQGGDLVNIQTREESFYINSIIDVCSRKFLAMPVYSYDTAARISTLSMFAYWIGANDRSSEGGWRWSDGSPFAYVNWASGEPNDYKHNEDCGALIARRGSSSLYKWNDFPCTLRIGITTRPTRPMPSPTPPVYTGKVFGCPDYWKPNGAFCYQFVQQKVIWNDAKASCLRRGSNLASIASQDEQNYIYSQLRNMIMITCTAEKPPISDN